MVLMAFAPASMGVAYEEIAELLKEQKVECVLETDFAKIIKQIQEVDFEALILEVALNDKENVLRLDITSHQYLQGAYLARALRKGKFGDLNKNKPVFFLPWSTEKQESVKVKNILGEEPRFLDLLIDDACTISQKVIIELKKINLTGGQNA